MIIDTSAVIAFFFREPGSEQIMHKLIDASQSGIGTPTLLECGIVLSARLGKDGRGMLSRFLEEFDISTLPFSDTHYRVAVGAWIKYGKGRQSTRLNLGDCMSYATAKLANMPLLCIGDDFIQTDLPLA